MLQQKFRYYEKATKIKRRHLCLSKREKDKTPSYDEFKSSWNGCNNAIEGIYGALTVLFDAFLLSVIVTGSI